MLLPVMPQLVKAPWTGELLLGMLGTDRAPSATGAAALLPATGIAARVLGCRNASGPPESWAEGREGLTPMPGLRWLPLGPPPPPEPRGPPSKTMLTPDGTTLLGPNAPGRMPLPLRKRTLPSFEAPLLVVGSEERDTLRLSVLPLLSALSTLYCLFWRCDRPLDPPFDMKCLASSSKSEGA